MGTISNKRLNLLINSDSKKLDIGSAFVEDLRRTVEKVNMNTSLPSPTYKPSSMQCIRNSYFQITEVMPDPSKPNPSAVGIAESGSARHEHLQRYVTLMHNYDIDCEWIDVEKYIQEKNLEDLEVISKTNYETKLYHKKLNIRFLCDGIIRYKNEYYIIEFKTEVSNKWMMRKDVASNHVVQACSYSAMFGIDKVLFVYESRDFCDWKGYVLNITPEMRKELVLRRIEECNKYIELGKVPPISKTQSKKMCNYCSYKLTCKKIGQTEDLFNE